MSGFDPTSSQLALISLGAVWVIFWKGLALWKSARNNDKIWFVTLLIINTLGILEILYLFVFSKREKSTKINKSSL